ncbi:MAG TPA: hypothetical protein VJ917_00760 [Saprospiraceae bacterium]|nr:hypothetical protein [Saprospiraceae bacterium]
MEEVKYERQLVWWLRILFPLFFLLFCILALVPIYLEYPQFEFWQSNLFFMLILGISLYWLFFHRFSLLVRYKWFKVVVVLAMPYLLVQVYNTIATFNMYVDQNYFLDQLFQLPYQRQNWLAQYIRREYLFTGVTAFLTAVILVFHFIRLLWFQINKR